MLDTVFGLPLHPLIVHATVVVVPLAALSVLLAAVWPRFRRWAGWGPAAVAVAAVVLAPLSTSSGEELEHRVGHSSLVERHAELGDRLIWFVLPLAVFAVLGYVLHRRGHLADGGSRAPVATMAVLPVLAALAAVAVLVQVVLIGHSGAEAAWSDVGSSSQSAGSADGG